MQAVRNTIILTIFFTFVLGIFGCIGSPSQIESERSNSTDSEPLLSPTSRILATSSPPPPSNTPEPVVTKTVTLELPTDTVQEAIINAIGLAPPADTLQFELLPCLPIVSDQNDAPLLQWQPPADNLRQIIGLSYPVESLKLSADGRWLIVTLKVDVQNQIPTLSTWMIDTVQEQHLQLNDNLSGRAHLTDWSSESELLWITQDRSVAVGNGEVFRDLAAPVPMIEVWYASGNIGFARDVDGFWWRFHIESVQWEPISTNDSEPLHGFGAVGISQNSSQVLLFQPGSVWNLPLSFGDGATEIGGHDISLVGSDSGFMPTVTQLGEEANWFTSASIWYPPGSQDTYPLEGFIFNTDVGRLLENSDFGIPESYKIVGFAASPDGKWLAVSLNKSVQTPNVRPTTIYLTQATQPESGVFLQDVKIIHLGTEYTLLQDDNNTLLALHLASDNAVRFDKAEFLSLLKNILVAREGSNHILRVDLSDNIIHGLNIPNGYLLQSTLVSSTGAVYLSLENGQSGICQSALLEYQP